MAMMVCSIIGQPGTGKSTLAWNLIRAMNCQFHTHRKGLCDYLLSEDGKVALLGKYEEGQLFCGTDKLSTNVERDARDLLEEIKFTGTAVFFEGDRLSTNTFLNFCSSVSELRLIAIEVSPHLLQGRRAERSANAGKEQDATWLKGRASKVHRLKMDFSAEVRGVNTMQQNIALAVEIKDWLLGLTEKPKVQSTMLF